MKKIFITTSAILFLLLALLAVILSTIGIETDKFNKFISDKTIESNRNVSLKLNKIRFKFDVKDFNLFLETENPKLLYKNLLIPIQNIKVYLDFYSLIKSKSKISKIYISSEEVNIDQLKNIVLLKTIVIIHYNL